MKNDIDFKVGDYCIYNTHGLAKITDIQSIEVGEYKDECLVLLLEKDKLKISIPVSEIKNGCIRKICSKSDIEEVFTVLSSGIKKLKGMWSRRAKEYDEKINSGNILLIAEVVKDLTRDIEEAQRSFSERMIYENAVNRLASEMSIVENISVEEATIRIIETSKQRVRFEDIKGCSVIKNA